MSTFTLICGLLAVTLSVLTALPTTNGRHWFVRIQEFPRVQYTALIALLLLLIVTGNMLSSGPSLWWALLLLAALGYQMYWIWPYTTFHPTEVPLAVDADGVSLRLMTCNVLMHNRDASRLLQQVHELQPDILVTLESDHWWQQQLDENLPELSHRIACPLDNLYGMHLYSRLPVESHNISYLVDEQIPSIAALLRVGPNDTPVHFHALHPTPPVPGENLRSTERDVELLMVADAVAGQREPVIVAGDLNDVAWSRTTRLFCNISGLLDPRIGRGLINTFHTKFRFLRWPLDHVFLSDHFTLRELRRLPDMGSDHFPVLADLVLGPSRDTDPKERTAGTDHELEQDLRTTDVAAQAERPPVMRS